jgi:hypothetical protein
MSPPHLSQPSANFKISKNKKELGFLSALSAKYYIVNYLDRIDIS